MSDPADAVVPAAAVVATNSETGTSYRTVSTSTGNYSVSSLPSGTYDVSVAVAGFKKYTQRGINVQVAQTARVDVRLEVGSTSDSVTVSADANLLKTEDAAQSETLSGDRINALPLNFAIGAGAIRNPLGFAALAPGSSINGWNDIKVNGAPNNTFRIIFEGQDTTSDLNPRVSDESQPSVESIQEFTLQTSNFAPEFGQVTGGLFNFTSRSGTNQFHGSAYDYFTNEKLNAGIPFTDTGDGHLVRPSSRKSDFGGSVGGPVWIPKIYNGRDHTFFFFNYEMYRSHQGNAVLGTVPTDAMRSGDFSAILNGRALGTDPLGRNIMENAIYNASTSRVVNGVIVRDPYQNNMIPASQMDPVALKIQALLPHATRSGNLNNFQESYNVGKIQAIPSIKIDHNFNERSHLAVYYSQQRTDKDNTQDGFPDPVSARRFQTIRSHTTRVNYDHSLTPTLLAHLGVGYQRYNNPDTAPDSVIAYDPISQLGLGGMIAGTGFPGIKFGNATSFGGANNSNAFGGVFENNGLGAGQASLGPINRNTYLMDKPTAVANITQVHGNHTFKAGGEWRLDTFSNVNTIGVSGIYNFSAIETGLPSTNGQNLQGGLVGFPYASFLTGAVNSGSISNPQAPQYRKMAWGFFWQDTWKVTRKLTVTYGLRYDYQPPPHELYYRTSEFSPTTPNPAAGGLLGATLYAGSGAGRCNCSFGSTYPYALGPRLGVAYQLDPKTVIRAGWAITYGQAPNFNYIGGGSSLGMGFNTINFSSPTYGVAALPLAGGLNYNQGALYAATYNAGIRPTPGLIDAPPALIDNNGGRPPRFNQWNISLQRELSKDLLVEAAYVANRGVWETANGLVSLNGLSPQRLAQFGLDATNPTTRALLTSPLSSPQAQAAGFKAPYAGYSLGNTVAQSLRPYPQFGNLSLSWAPLGSSWYDALQLKVTKRLSHGLDLSASYTRSKNLTTAEDQDGTTVPTANVFNRSANKTFSRNDQPNIFVVSFNYQTPNWGPNAWTKRIVGGWTLGGILRYSSGTPIQAPNANNSLNSVYFTGTFANRVPGQPLFLQDLNCGCIDPNKQFVLNPKAWTDPAQGQFTTSNAYYNDYRYARRPDEELSFGRLFKIRESMSLQIRAEFFNVFNRTYLNNPDNLNAGATQALNPNGSVSSGFGRINSGSTFNTPRSGQLVARFQF